MKLLTTTRLQNFTQEPGAELEFGVSSSLYDKVPDTHSASEISQGRQVERHKD